MLPLIRGKGEAIIIDTPSDSTVLAKRPRAVLPLDKIGMDAPGSVIIYRELLLAEK